MNQVIAILSMIILLSGCSMLDHSFKGWIGGGYSVEEGEDADMDPIVIPPKDLEKEPANPASIKLELPDEMKPAREPAEIEEIDPNADPNGEYYQCLEEKGFLECRKALDAGPATS